MPRMSKRARRERAVQVAELLAEVFPDADCALDHDGPFQLLAATILSAQCTDERVNMVTPALFARYPDAASLARAEQEDVEELVRSTGFYRNKATNLRGMAQRLVERHDGEVPVDIDALVELPGVARKTANVVLGTAFGENHGVVVDTHVHRITHRLGLTREHDPKKVERDLMDLLPRSEWTVFSHRVILHGRAVCKARKPRCAACVLREGCPARQDVARPRKLLSKKEMTTPRRRRRRKGSPRK